MKHVKTWNWIYWIMRCIKFILPVPWVCYKLDQPCIVQSTYSNILNITMESSVTVTMFSTVTYALTLITITGSSNVIFMAPQHCYKWAWMYRHWPPVYCASTSSFWENIADYVNSYLWKFFLYSFCIIVRKQKGAHIPLHFPCYFGSVFLLLQFQQSMQ